MKYWDDVMPPVPGTAMGYHSDENLALMQKQQKQAKADAGIFMSMEIFLKRTIWIGKSLIKAYRI